MSIFPAGKESDRLVFSEGFMCQLALDFRAFLINWRPGEGGELAKRRTASGARDIKEKMDKK